MQITQKQAKDAMRNTFVRLMLLQTEGEVQWLGTVSDLVELVHMMWYDGLTIDECGQVLNFSTTVDRLCRRLNLRAPRKPNTVMNNVRKRKNPDLLLIARCQRLMEQGEDPLARFLATANPADTPLYDAQRWGTTLCSDADMEGSEQALSGGR